MSEHGVVTEPGTIRFERLLPGPIERVWAYLTEADKRRQWFAGGEMELREGGRADLLFRHAELMAPGETAPEKYKEVERGIVSSERILRCEPPRLLAFTWGHPEGSQVTIELSPRGGEVLLTLTHRGLVDRASLADVAGGWHLHLAMLAARLAGRTPPPFWATHASLEAEYERRLPA